jgi:hypothetical protein
VKRVTAVRHVLLLVLVAPAGMWRCGGSASHPTSPESQTSLSSGLTSIGSGGDSAVMGTLVGAGDIGVCGSPGPYLTASLLDTVPGTVFTAGDNAYFSGTAADFKKCYDPTWGRHRARTRPSPGNHEYESGGSAYFDYFGANAGPPGLGYYSYTIGSWKLLSLNSEVPSGPGSAQGEWLREELSGRQPGCTAAYWHRPLFSSGRIGDNTDMRPLFQMLYDAGVDLVINGHDHLYERFAPQDPEGRVDTARGIREFIVGTGGAPLTGVANLHANSDARATVWGVAMFTLYERSYQWRFVPTDDQTPEDSGTAVCH